MEETFSVVKSLHPMILRSLGAFAVVICLIPGTLLAQQPAAPQLPGRIDPQARQMLDRAIQALGGQAFLNAKSLTMKGRVFFFYQGTTGGIAPFQSYVLYPDKFRFSYGKTLPVVWIYNADKSWELDRYGLTSQLDTPQQIWGISNRYGLENLLRLRINESGVLIQTGKVDFVDNVPTLGIEIIEPGGTSVRLDLHPQTFLPSRVTHRVRNVKEDAWDEFSDAYADYKPVDGIQTPMHVTRYLNGDRVLETFGNLATYNEEYPPNYFTAE